MLVPAACGEVREQLECEQVRAAVGELRAEVDVQAFDVEPSRAGSCDRLEGVVRVEPELRPAVARANGLVGLRLDAECHAHEHAPHSRGGGALDLVECVQHHEGVELGGGS